MVNATNNDLYHNSSAMDSPNIGNTSGAIELSNNISALIDKIHIKNVEVTDVKDIYSLRDRDILIVKEGKNNYLFNERGEGYSSISISAAKNFDKFDYYLTRWGHISSYLQISIDDSIYRNLNCYSVEDYKDRLVAIQEELLCNYGISVSFENAEIEYIEINKTIVIYSIDRLGRNYEEIKNQWEYITKIIKADIKVLDMPLLDTRSSKDNDIDKTFISDLVLQILSYVAEKERINIHTRQRAGIDCMEIDPITGKKIGKKGRPTGRPAAEFPDNWNEVYKKWKSKEITATNAMKELGVKRNTFYNLVKRYDK